MRETDGAAYLSHQFIPRLRPLAGMGPVAELNGADNREIAGAADDEVEVFGCDAIKHPLPGRPAQASLDLCKISKPNLT